MALEDTTNKQSFTAVAGETHFVFNVPFFDASTIDETNKKYGDIKVTRESAGVITQFTPVATFSSPAVDGEFKIIATNNDPEQGGTVTISTAALGGEKFIVERDVAYSQQYDLQEGSTIDPTALNKALDRVVAQNQQQNDAFTRTVQFPVTDSPSTTYTVGSETTRANKALGFDASGNVTEINLVDRGAISGDANAGISINNNIISAKVDNSTTQFSGGNIAVKTVDTAQLASSSVTTDKLENNAVTTNKIASDNVTYDKIQDITTSNSVLGNTGTGTVAERALVGDILLDEDNMATDSNTKGATQQSIKAYVDSQTIGVGQTWQAVTRNFNTNYQNNTGKPISLNIAANSNTDYHSIDITITPSGGSAVTIRLANSSNSGGGVASNGSIIIPNNSTYQLNLVSGSQSLTSYEVRELR